MDSARALMVALVAASLVHCSSGSDAANGGPDGAEATASNDARNDSVAPEGNDGEALSADTGGGGRDEDANEAGTSDAPGPEGAGAAGTDASLDASHAPYSPCPPPGMACRILPLGDSITAGIGSSTGGSYRLRLLHDIWGAQHDATFVGANSNGPNTLDGKPFPKANDGYSGYTIDPAPAPANRAGISPLVPAALTKYSPHVVTLMIGTNDVGTNNDLANAPNRLAKLIDVITTMSPGTLLIVAQITPTGSDASNTLTQAYNAAIPSLVKTRAAAGKHVIMVDMYSAFTQHAAYRTDYMHDSLHPNDTGYDVMGDVWYAALAPYL